MEDEGVAATLRGFGHGWQGQHNSTHAVVASTLRAEYGEQSHRGDGADPLVTTPAVFRKAQRAHTPDDGERWQEDELADTLDAAGHTARTATAVVGTEPGEYADDPKGLDSNRYRVIGNGVVAPNAYWLGVRLAALAADWDQWAEQGLA